MRRRRFAAAYDGNGRFEAVGAMGARRAWPGKVDERGMQPSTPAEQADEHREVEPPAPDEDFEEDITVTDI